MPSTSDQPMSRTVRFGLSAVMSEPEAVDGEADRERAVAAEDVAELRAGEHERRHHQRVGGDRELDALDRRVEVLDDLRDRHVHDAAVEHHHELRRRRGRRSAGPSEPDAASASLPGAAALIAGAYVSSRTTRTGRRASCSSRLRRRAEQLRLHRAEAARADDDRGRVALLGDRRDGLGDVGAVGRGERLGPRAEARARASRRPRPSTPAWSRWMRSTVAISSGLGSGYAMPVGVGRRHRRHREAGLPDAHDQQLAVAEQRRRPPAPRPRDSGEPSKATTTGRASSSIGLDDHTARRAAGVRPRRTCT